MWCRGAWSDIAGKHQLCTGDRGKERDWATTQTPGYLLLGICWRAILVVALMPLALIFGAILKCKDIFASITLVRG